mmetsp:Transcript_91115/g.235305  ORF Transcript_91115/g.235305 Transcript_91115/m.235305 type:complete len:269 (+) Transcript_91115:841-1647(+)
MWRRTLRISALTFMRGCSAPPAERRPLALTKFRGLNVCSFQVPLMIISCVTSATAFFAEENASVGVTLKAVRLVGATSLRFLSASIAGLSRLARFWRSFCTSSATASTAAVKALVALSMAIHRFFIATPEPTLPTSPSASSRTSLVAPPLALTTLKTCTSGLPSLEYCSPSAVSFHPSRFMGALLVRSAASSDLMRPTSFSWSQPFCSASTTESAISPFSWMISTTASRVAMACKKGRYLAARRKGHGAVGRGDGAYPGTPSDPLGPA